MVKTCLRPGTRRVACLIALVGSMGGTPAPAQIQPAASPTKGTYHCVAAGGIAGTLQLVIKDDSHYADRNGKTGEYGRDPKTHRLVFRTGPWEGYYGGILGPRKIGLSSRPGGSFNTVCDLK